jgi:hypothetical protein
MVALEADVNDRSAARSASARALSHRATSAAGTDAVTATRRYDIALARPGDLSHIASIELAAAGLLAGFAPEAVLEEVTSEEDLRAAQCDGRLWVALSGDVPVEQSALSSTRDAARYELFEASQRLESARQTFDIVDGTLLPRSVQSFESAQAAYRGGSADSIALFDALSALLDVRIERERALVRMDTALADIERALGGSIPSAPASEDRHDR